MRVSVSGCVCVCMVDSPCRWSTSNDFHSTLVKAEFMKIDGFDHDCGNYSSRERETETEIRGAS